MTILGCKSYLSFLNQDWPVHPSKGSTPKKLFTVTKINFPISSRYPIFDPAYLYSSKLIVAVPQ